MHTLFCSTLFVSFTQLDGSSQVALVVKNPPASPRDVRGTGLIPGLGRSTRRGNGNPPQYSCLENSMSRGAWWATVLGAAKSQTQLRDWAHPGWYTEFLFIHVVFSLFRCFKKNKKLFFKKWDNKGYLSIKKWRDTTGPDFYSYVYCLLAHFCSQKIIFHH